jgi:OOP family OmpA-OmpF porin
MPRLKKGPKLLLVLLIGGSLFVGLRTAMARGILPTPGFLTATEIKSDATVASIEDAAVGTVTALPLPGTEAADVTGPEFRAEVWAWNAQIACVNAIGGPQTTTGSAFARRQIRATIRRQDDTQQMANDLAAYSKAYAAGDKNPTVGVNAVAIMGSQAGGFLESLNQILAQYQDAGEIVYVCGRSDGEDALMGPASWKQNPQAARGGVVSQVPMEGDADITKKWAKDNGLKYNADEKTYDPDAINVMPAGTYIESAQRYVSDYCETRPVVRAGRQTGEQKRICIDGVASWTPADVTVATGRGGLVRIVSTHEYSGIMPNAWIVLKRWAADHNDLMVKVVQAFGESGTQVRARPEALARACEVSAQVYAEETAEFWCRYYRGTTEPDKTGRPVQLGGSKAATLADNQTWFGLKGEPILKRTYTTFATLLTELHPDIYKHFPPADDVVNDRYVRAALASASTGETGTVEQTTFTSGYSGTRVAKRSWAITFHTGSAEFTPAAKQTLDELLNDLVIAGSLAVEVQGHTDNVGDAAANLTLSERRARAVAQYLQTQAPDNFPTGRVSVKAFGQTQPIAPNTTEPGRAQNRRVEIVLRSAE